MKPIYSEKKIQNFPGKAGNINGKFAPIHLEDYGNIHTLYSHSSVEASEAMFVFWMFPASWRGGRILLIKSNAKTALHIWREELKRMINDVLGEAFAFYLCSLLVCVSLVFLCPVYLSNEFLPEMENPVGNEW